MAAPTTSGAKPLVTATTATWAGSTPAAATRARRAASRSATRGASGTASSEGGDGFTRRPPGRGRAVGAVGGVVRAAVVRAVGGVEEGDHQCASTPVAPGPVGVVAPVAGRAAPQGDVEGHAQRPELGPHPAHEVEGRPARRGSPDHRRADPFGHVGQVVGSERVTGRLDARSEQRPVGRAAEVPHRLDGALEHPGPQAPPAHVGHADHAGAAPQRHRRAVGGVGDQYRAHLAS